MTRGADDADDGAEGRDDELRPAGSAGRATLTGLGSSVCIILANLVSGIITARLLGPEGRAAVITATVWTLVGSWIAMVGIRQSVQFHLAPVRRRTTSASIASSALVMVTALALVASVVAQGVVGLVIDDQTLLGPTRAMLLALVVLVWYEVLCGVLLGRHRVALAVSLRTAQAVLYVVFVATLGAVGWLSAVTALSSLAASFAVPVLVGVVLVMRTGGLGRPRVRYMRQVFGFGVRAYPGSLATLTNARIDLLVVPAVLAPAAVGFYGVASNTSSVLQQLLGNVALVLFPALVAGDPEQRRELLERAVRLILVAGLVSACAGGVLAGPVVRLLYGEDFGPTVPLLRILLFATVSYALLGVIASGLAAHGMPVRSSLANVIGVPVTVVGLVVMVPLLGAAGAAVTSLIAYTVCLASAVALCPRDLLRVRSLVSWRNYRADVSPLVSRVAAKRSRRGKGDAAR